MGGLQYQKLMERTWYYTAACLKKCRKNPFDGIVWHGPSFRGKRFPRRKFKKFLRGRQAWLAMVCQRAFLREEQEQVWSSKELGPGCSPRLGAGRVMSVAVLVRNVLNFAWDATGSNELHVIGLPHMGRRHTTRVMWHTRGASFKSTGRLQVNKTIVLPLWLSHWTRQFSLPVESTTHCLLGAPFALPPHWALIYLEMFLSKPWSLCATFQMFFGVTQSFQSPLAVVSPQKSCNFFAVWNHGELFILKFWTCHILVAWVNTLPGTVGYIDALSSPSQ